MDKIVKKVSLKFKEVDASKGTTHYTDGCSGGVSDCCTRTCTRANIKSTDDSLNAWDDYLEVNAGILQY